MGYLHLKRTALLIIILTILSKFVSFGREIMLAYFYGASSISDAYIISIAIPGAIFAFIASGISTVFIPMYTKIETEFGVTQANKYTNNLVNSLLLICTLLISFSLIFTEQIVRVFALGFEGEILNLAVSFTRISLLGIYFAALFTVFNAFLQIKGNYTIPALIVFPYNFCIIISIILSSKGNIMILAFGLLFAAIAQFLFLLPFIAQKGFTYSATVNITDPNIKEMVYLALPVIIGVAVNDVNLIVDKTMASQIYEGGISVLNYAQRLNGFVQGIVVLSVATAMYPLISKMAAENNIVGLKKTLSEAITGITILVIPCTIGAMVLSQPIIEMLFGRGAFDDQAIVMTANALFFYAIGMIGVGLRDILSRPFYALQDTKTPMINAAIGMGLNIILNIILYRFLGIGGLALATSISAIFTSILLITSIRKKIGTLGFGNIMIFFCKILSASIAMGVIAKVIFNYLNVTLSQNLSLLLAMAVGAISYFVMIYFMKIEDVDAVVKAVRKRIGERIA